MQVVSTPKRGRPASASKPAAAPVAPKRPVSPSSQPALDSPLTAEEEATFTQAVMELFDMADSGLWYVGLDTDPDTMDRKGNPGVPIWHLEDAREARQITKAFLAVGKRRPGMYAAMRALNNAHSYLQAGLILGSRFFETGVRLFQTGLNFRMSKTAWEASVNQTLASQPAPRGIPGWPMASSSGAR